MSSCPFQRQKPHEAREPCYEKVRGDLPKSEKASRRDACDNCAYEGPITSGGILLVDKKTLQSGLDNSGVQTMFD